MAVFSQEKARYIQIKNTIQQKPDQFYLNTNTPVTVAISGEAPFINYTGTRLTGKS